MPIGAVLVSDGTSDTKRASRASPQPTNSKLHGGNFELELETKINYRIHTDAIKEQIIPKEVTRAQASIVYASEADLLNMALFGKTAVQWRAANPNLEGNMRDYATLEQLVVLSNMESINALLIRQGLSQGDRLVQLNAAAIAQMKSLVGASLAKRLE